MIRLPEDPESRDLHYGSQGGGQTLRFTAITTAGESEVLVYLHALVNTPPYFNGFIRQDIKVTRKGAPHLFGVLVEYGTTGVGGGDQPLGGPGGDGGPPATPTAPAADNTPLASGYAFSIRAPRLHLTQSRATVASYKRGGGPAPDFKRAIGVDKDGKPEGCDVPPDPRFTFKRTVARATVTPGYLETLEALAGRPNDAPFYGRAAGEVLYLAADGQYTQGDGWSITHEFGVEANETGIAICAGLDGIAKKGWEYLWVLYEEVRDGNKVLTVPAAAYVEEVLRPAPFHLIEIGA